MAIGIACKDCGDIIALQPEAETIANFFADTSDYSPTVKVNCPGRGEKHPTPPGYPADV